MTSVLAPPIAEDHVQPPAGRARGGAGTATFIGMIGFFVSFAGSWQPSYWGDEAVSVMSAQRTLPSLFELLGHIDAVHGAYYLVLHFWIDLFGTSELSTRMPSALAAGAAAAGTAVLARLLINARVAVLAGLIFAVLPRVTYMGAEARSAAIATAVAVWLTVLLVHLLRSDARSRGGSWVSWAAYAVLLAAGIYAFLYLVLLIPVHGLAFLVLRPAPDRVARWAAATIGGLILSLPVVYWGIRESWQISYIARRPQVEPQDAAVLQWFGNTPFALAAWTLVIVGVVAVFALPRVREIPGSTRGALALMLAWMLLPSVVLLVGTHLVTPMYSLRYLSFCTPAVAIAIAVGIACFRWRLLQPAALLLLIMLALPTYLSQRSEFGKNGGSDWRQVAAAIEARADAGDAVVFDETPRLSRHTRLAMNVYPDSFRGLRDITIDRPYASINWVFDRTIPLDEATHRLAGSDTVWLLQYKGSRGQREGGDIRTLQQEGFAVADTITVNRTIIIEMTR